MKLKIKVAVAANADGKWHAYGFPTQESWQDAMDSFETLDGEHRFWIEAEVDVPDVVPVIDAMATAA